jgi:N-acetylmuramoyl-L-alanine amidase
MLPITDITIHCTATPEGRDNSAAEVTKWDIERFNQPSYHAVVELDGDVVRTLRDDQRGAHTGGHNTGNLGISYVGGTTSMNSGAKPKDTRTDAQKAGLEKQIRAWLAEHPGIKRIRGHRQWPAVQKACPSFDVTAWLEEIGLGQYAVHP